MEQEIYLLSNKKSVRSVDKQMNIKINNASAGQHTKQIRSGIFCSMCLLGIHLSQLCQLRFVHIEFAST
jgi:hypothetical protein